MSNLWKLATTLQSDAYTMVDLSHPLVNDSPAWEGIPRECINLGTPCFDWGNGLLECQIQTFTFPGQFGTHIDFPGHFKQGAPLANAFGPRDMILPLVVLDISDKVKEDADYAVSVADIEAHEAKYGTIPAGSFVALRTDWASRWDDGITALNNPDSEGNAHTPGWSLEALKFLYETRKIKANGHETLDTDASKFVPINQDLACERYVLSEGHFQIEVMNNLDKVPPVGALIFLSWANIKEANGLPVRPIAIFEKE